MELVKTTKDWKEYRAIGRVPATYLAGEAQAKLFFGRDTGTVEVADIEVMNYGRNADESKFNPTIDYYGGTAVDDRWKAAANERIEKIRKGGIEIKVVGTRGKPIKGATVKITQQRHAFRFGTAGPAFRLFATDPDSVRYRTEVERLFNTFVFENDLKWDNANPDTFKNVDQAMVWLEQRGFAVRGHNLVWGDNQYLPQSVQKLGNAETVEAVRTHIADYAGKMKGRLYTWDVVNEGVSAHTLWDRIGWQHFVDAYKWAQEADPKALLTYNDFNITSEAATGAGQRIKAIEKAKSIRAGGASFDLFGEQAHLGPPFTPIPRVLEILSDVSKQVGAPIEITEFDLNVRDEAVHAKYCADYMTAAFSSPSVVSFVMWGFWEGQHWIPNGAMFKKDWTPKAWAKAYEKLVKGDWWTNLTLQTDASGKASARAFYGTHKVEATVGGKTVTATIELKPGNVGSFVLRMP
jgi:GH35 family endo-1,4-beta-xylanase